MVLGCYRVSWLLRSLRLGRLGGTSVTAFELQCDVLTSFNLQDATFAKERCNFSTSRPCSSREQGLFDKILVANRGEIAVRIMKTAKRLGIKTVAVYSEADANSLHTRYADEAVCIGPPPSLQSYLNVDAILEAIRRTGAQAVHPGYGFLSENAAFAQRLAAEGVQFVGPPAAAIAAMGDKVESKRLALAAGVNTIPGWVGEVEDGEHALKVAEETGFPLMIKASGGGGGKGMRIVRSMDEVADSFQLSKQEAQSSFGDNRMLIERYVEQPRHIEIQVLGDKYGQLVYLPERECSIQRRNQKVVEEAPSTFLDSDLRQQMGEQALSLCRAVGYYSAGTLEFLVDQQRNFYFLEMNTRLQVEHPVTELVSGLDLVEQMLRVAAGKHLGFTQDQVRGIKGWALECRVYAEEPHKNFMPSVGRLQRYREPKGEGVRVDAGVTEGSEISMYYDPMISKLVTHGATRQEAIEKMKRALDSYVIRGVGNNLQMLRQVISHPAFAAGHTDTGFLVRHWSHVYTRPQKGVVLPPSPGPVPQLQQDRQGHVLALTVLQALHREARLHNLSPAHYLASTLPDGCAQLSISEADHQWVATARPASAQLLPAEDVANGGLEVEVAGGSFLVAPIIPTPNSKLYCPELHYAKVNGEVHIYQILSRGPRSLQLQYEGVPHIFKVERADLAPLAAFMPPPTSLRQAKVLSCPMAGSLISVAVEVGSEVEEGDELAVVEAMKMRNVLRCTVPGRVKALHCLPGQILAVDQVILEFE